MSLHRSPRSSQRPSLRTLQIFTALFAAAFAGLLATGLTHRTAVRPVERIGLPPVPPAAPAVVAPAPPPPQPPHPIALEAFSWHREGFDTVAVASFQLRNGTDRTIQGVELVCTYTGAQGIVASRRRAVYEIVGAGQTVFVRALNIGLIPDGSTAVRCEAAT